MSMGMEVGIFLTYAMGMLVIYIAGRYLMIPIKWIMRFVANSLLGGIIIFIINFCGSGLGIFLPLNLITVLIAGILGVPGILAMIIFFA